MPFALELPNVLEAGIVSPVIYSVLEVRLVDEIAAPLTVPLAGETQPAVPPE